MNYWGILSAFSFHLQGEQRINKKKLRRKSTKSHSMHTESFPFQVTISQTLANNIETCTSITDPHYSSFGGFVKTIFLPILFSSICFFSSCLLSVSLFCFGFVFVWCSVDHTGYFAYMILKFHTALRMTAREANGKKTEQTVWHAVIL